MSEDSFFPLQFSAGTVGLWTSTGSAPLVQVVQNVAASTSTNSEGNYPSALYLKMSNSCPCSDWHLGVLKLVEGPNTEDWYFSGVYIESGPITTSIGSGSSTNPSSSSTVTPPQTSVIVATTSTPTTSSTTTPSGPTQTHYGQCGGNYASIFFCHAGTD